MVTSSHISLALGSRLHRGLGAPSLGPAPPLSGWAVPGRSATSSHCQAALQRLFLPSAEALPSVPVSASHAWGLGAGPLGQRQARETEGSRGAPGGSRAAGRTAPVPFRGGEARAPRPRSRLRSPTNQPPALENTPTLFLCSPCLQNGAPMALPPPGSAEDEAKQNRGQRELRGARETPWTRRPIYLGAGHRSRHFADSPISPAGGPFWMGPRDPESPSGLAVSQVESGRERL